MEVSQPTPGPGNSQHKQVEQHQIPSRHDIIITTTAQPHSSHRDGPPAVSNRCTNRRHTTFSSVPYLPVVYMLTYTTLLRVTIG